MAEMTREGLAVPETGEPLAPRDQPGYYPRFSTLSQQRYWDGTTRRVVLKRMTEIPEIRFFAADEALTMRAVVDRILPQEDRTAHRRIPILPALDHRLDTNQIEGYRYEDMPPDQQAYKLAARAFEAMGQALHGKKFHELETMQQEEILKSIHDAKPLAGQELWAAINVERFWSMLVSDCASAYYSHPWAWDEVGFGGPAYPRGYMRLEEGETEPWEVQEKRYNWAAPADTLSGIEESAGQGDSHQTQPGQGGTH